MNIKAWGKQFLMFAGKAEAYLSEAPFSCSALGKTYETWAEFSTLEVAVCVLRI